MDFIREVESQTGVPIKSFGHAGDGNLHIYILKESDNEREYNPHIGIAMDRIYDFAKGLKGQVSGEHGIGHEKRAYLNSSLSGTVLDLMRGIKKVFDPENILNPSKIL